MKFVKLFIGLAAGSLACTAGASVYKSVDSEGNVSYGTSPYTEGAQPVNIEKQPPTNEQLQQRQEKLQRQQQREATLEQQNKATTEEQAEQQAYQDQITKLCAQYRNNLELLQSSGRRVYTVDKDGQYHYFSEEEKQAETARLQQNIERYCKDG